MMLRKRFINAPTCPSLGPRLDSNKNQVLVNVLFLIVEANVVFIACSLSGGSVRASMEASMTTASGRPFAGHRGATKTNSAFLGGVGQGNDNIDTNLFAL